MKHVVTTAVAVFFVPIILVSGTITREYQKTFDFSGDNVEVKTTNGKIFVESWRKRAVDVYAEIEVRAGSKEAAREFMDQVEIIVRDRGDQISIKVDQPQNTGGGFLDWIFGDGKPNVTVDFWIKVPEAMDIVANSVNGSIEVVDISGKATLHTTNGKIVAEDIVGPVEATTTNGSIFVEIETDELEDNVILKTVNGSIKLSVDSDVEADVDISTVNGSISTDFPLQVEGKWGPKSVRGEINGGGALIELETVNGSVSIREN